MAEPNNDRSTTKSNLRFAVTTVESEETDDFHKNDTTLCPSTAENTIGYGTHEAVPMTVFYRNDSSHVQGNAKGKSRPTLDQLRKGFESNSPEIQPMVADEETGVTDLENRPSIKLNKFGWIKGVLVPCLLNIWGVMLFLRLTWVVGQAGIGLSIVIILLSASVTTLTSISMSAICTNGQIKGGGAYYLISRSLGPEFGGSIGLIFSLANAVAVAMYVVGFAETVAYIMAESNSLMINEINDTRIIGLGTVVILLGLTLIGLDWVLKAQLGLLFLLLAAMISVVIGFFVGPLNDNTKSKGFVGISSSVFSENFPPSYTGKENFFSVFAVFFPAATGILAGVNISGDLDDAQQAIPKGTFLAIGVTGVVYVLLGIMAGSCAVRDATGIVNETITCAMMECEYGLNNDYQLMQKISIWAPLVIIGIFAATLSSALASLVGAPKVFQAVCRDEIFPYIKYFAEGRGPNNEPRRAYILVFFIASGFIAIAELNVIAPIISNFFLMSYALINYAVFAASLGRSPGWRPSFKYYNKWVSLFGALLCIAIMFLIEWWAALVTIVIIGALYKYVSYTKPQVNWGSSTQAVTYRTILAMSYQYNEAEEHVKNFRPQCLVLCGSPENHEELVHIVSHVTKNNGLMICGEVTDSVGTKQDVRKKAREWLHQNKIKAFHCICTAREFRSGVSSLLQCTGLGKMKPNTVFLGFKTNWRDSLSRNSANDDDAAVGEEEIRVDTQDEGPTQLSKDFEDSKGTKDYVNVIQDAFDQNLGVAIFRSNFNDTDNMKNALRILNEKREGTIDVWWLFDDGGLTLLIPYLLSLNRYWKKCDLRVFTPKSMQKESELSTSKIRMVKLLKQFRIDVSRVIEFDGISEKPKDDSITDFTNLAGHTVEGENRKRSLRHIRLGELLKKHSNKDTSLIVMTLPVPSEAVEPTLYMSWLEMMTRDLPPILLIRGNHTNVLTFYT
ncbi:solute carrier family 12 member 2-like [Dendronephthya gigantea]|uniref:solute carrier family 12 member 2-like n=1 Tax=Dendronephthya gigantea TaxID=151771 RepID=UPI00106A70D5|nr:solute carrier family 12 member 2-like [Dendronephthya gigantea]